MPVFWISERSGTYHLPTLAADDAGMKFLHHPGRRVLLWKRIGSLKSLDSGRRETESWVITRVPEYKDEIHASG
jgi:hypothetical protein